MIRCIILFLAFATGITVLYAQPTPPVKKFRLPDDLIEVSGLVWRGADSLWWHNDGGNESALYLTDGRGCPLRKVPLPYLRNVDWEDLTVDDRGRLYIGDFGDNLNQRTDLRVYRYDPANGAVDSILFRFPDRTGYDTEGFLWHADSLHLFTKNKLPRSDFYTKHFVLPASPGDHEAELRDSLRLRKRVVTGAAIEPATGRVALVAYYFRMLLGIFPTSAASVFVFDDYPPGHFLRGRMHRKRISCLFAKQYESIDFVGPGYVLVASEKTLFIRPKAKRVRLSYP